MKRAAVMRPVRSAKARACLHDQRGLSTLEYALVFVVIIVGALALWRKLGTSLAANVGAGQRTLSQTLDSAMAANRDAANSGPSSLAPRPGADSVGSTSPALHARATSPSSAASQSTASGSTRTAAAAAHSGTMTQAANSTVTQGRSTQPGAAAPSTPGRSSSTATTPVQPRATPGLLEQAKDYVVNSSAAQYALGIGAGILQGYTPGGFLVPSPNASSKPFEIGRGLGQMSAGIAETVAGLGMVGGGGAATGLGAVTSFTPASPAGVALVAAGAPVAVAGVGVVANGVGATLSGYGTFINAMSMSDSAPPAGGSSGTASGGAPLATAPSKASTGVTRPTVSDPKLNNLVNDLYKGAKTKHPIGTGSTADAIRHEAATGQAVGGKFHTQKGTEYARALENWLGKNPGASSADRTAAQSILDDLRSALGGK